MAQLQFHQKSVFVILLVIVTKSNAFLDNPNKPCKYLDSINITDGVKNGNDSITFEDINYPKNLYATFNYELKNESYRQEVAPHLRGCTCKINPEKSCVRMCCQRGQFYHSRQCFENDVVRNLAVNVSNNEGQVSEENMFDKFNYVVGRPCGAMNRMEPDRYPESDSWVLFEVIDCAEMMYQIQADYFLHHLNLEWKYFFK